MASRLRPTWLVLIATIAVVACAGGDRNAIRVTMDELVSGVELAEVDDPQGVVLLAEALALDMGPPPGTVDIDRTPNDARYDVVLSYGTGGCPALPELAVDVVDDVLRFEVEIVDPGGDCPAAAYIEAIGIDLVASAEELPVDATLR